MSHKIFGIALSCVVCTSCMAGGQRTFPPVPVPSAPDLSVETEPRLSTFVSERRGIRSVVLSPSLVDGVGADGGSASSRVFAGAFFVTRTVPEGELSGLALVFQALGGGLGPALSAQPTLTLEVDGEPLLDNLRVTSSMFDFSRGPWGPIESVVLPVSPFILHRVSSGDRVKVRIGDSISFELNAEQRSGVAELLNEIPEGTRFGVRMAAKWGGHETE